MNKQPEQLMFHGREIAMTEAEQSLMRRNLVAYTNAYRPHTATATGAYAWVRHHAAATASLVALLALGGTGVSASMAEPNDALYGLKTQVTDRIESAITFDDEAQLDVELRQIERQLNAESDALDDMGTDENMEDADESDTPKETPQSHGVNVIERLKDNLRAQFSSRKKSETDDDRGREEERLEQGGRERVPFSRDDDGLEDELRGLDRDLRLEESTSVEFEE